jgi:hypothetical protein
MSDPSCIVVSSRKGRHMPKYYVEMRIDFNGEIEADSKEHAEELAWTSWGDTADNDITYDGVYSIDVSELDEEDEDEDDE